MFPYSSEIEISKDKKVSWQTVIQEIGPILTRERKARIDHVIEGRNFNHTIVLENLYDRGNGSAVMRSAEAFGFQNFDVIEINEKFKASNRVASGAEKWLNIRKWQDTKSCVQKLKHEGYRICVTSLEASTPLQEVDWSIPSALVLGNEKEGVSKEMLEMSDVRVIIPMAGFVQSFNISVAGALSLFHISEHNKKNKHQLKQLSDEEKMILKAHYYMRTLDSAKDILLSKLITL